MDLEIIETNPLDIIGVEIEVDMDIDNEEDTRTLKERLEKSISPDGLPILGDHLGGDGYAELE